VSKHIETVQPAAWSKPRGYANGVVARGRTLFVAGQIGWDPASEKVVSDDFAQQFGQALDNVLAVVRAGGGDVGDVCKMTVFVTDMKAYRESLAELGRVWLERMGRQYPAMALVAVTIISRSPLLRLPSSLSISASW
jgi:enamine deaminase RidA (YjgF/YER057c/UK114 family)